MVAAKDLLKRAACGAGRSEILRGAHLLYEEGIQNLLRAVLGKKSIIMQRSRSRV